MPWGWPNRRLSDRRAAGRGTFYSLQNNSNFRLYWIGAFLSNVGTWMQMVAQGWLVYELTNSAFLLGLATFVGSIPILLLGLVGGVLADRTERRRLMIWTQTGMMLLAFLLAGLTLAGIVTIWHILIIAFLNGIVNAFNTPVRQSLVADLVPKADFQNAIALNSAQYQISKMLGPALAGVTLVTIGAGWCFFINAVSFLTVIVALFLVKVPPLPLRPQRSMLGNISEALRYVWSYPTIFMLLIMAAVPNLVAMPYQSMMPAVAVQMLNSGATGLGLLQSAAGAGALVGALLIASLSKGANRSRMQLSMLFLFGLFLALFGLSRWMPLSLLLVFVVGAASMSYSSLNQTFIQSEVHDDVRGRVTSVYSLSTLGIQPVGALIAGAIGNLIGVWFALLLGGAICLALSLAATRIRRTNLSTLT